MESFKSAEVRRWDWTASLVLGIVAAVFYFASMATYAFPGEGAHLMALWRGLDSTTVHLHPLMAFFAKLFGGGNVLGPVSGVVSVVALYHLTAFFVRERINDEAMTQYADRASRIAGVLASVFFMFTPAVREASTHLSAYGFDAAWALVTAFLLVGYARAGKRAGWLYPALIGVFFALGLADSFLFALLAPGYLAGIWVVSAKRGNKPYGALAGFVIVALVAFFVYAPLATGDFSEAMSASMRELRMWRRVSGWLFVAVFAILPFVLSLISSGRAYNKENGFSQWTYHVAMSFVAILAFSTPLSPSELMRPHGILPVVPCALVAFTAAGLFVYWWLLAVAKVQRNESVDEEAVQQKGRPLAFTVLPVLALAYGFTVLLHLFAFDGDRGAYADRAAERLIADLGERSWFVTDGLLDDHLRLAAAKSGKDLNLVCLQRDADKHYLDDLAQRVEKDGLGGVRNKELLLSLKLGVMSFVQDWFASETNLAGKVAVFSAPDLLYAAGHKAVPEFLFFGADASAKPDWSAWKEFDAVFAKPKGAKTWGSYRLWKERDPVEMLRLRLRMHLGLVANDRGVWLQDAGDDDGAFAMYELVLNEIDYDNICTLFNEYEMARAGHKKAVQKLADLEKSLRAIVADKDRRYIIWRLASVYGYIRNPDIFVRLGYDWARSGRPGEALSQVRRAVEFVPSERRSGLLNMMAALYANDRDTKKSREVYEQVLAQDAENHDALIGLMRLSILEGDTAKAVEYLERATKSVADDPRVAVELAMLHLLKGEYAAARAALVKASDGDPSSVRPWSLLAAVVMQQYDASKDEAERERLLKEVETRILPEMERRVTGRNDYNLQTTRAFLHMRQGEEGRKKARDALAVASRVRPDVQSTRDLVLGLDIQLNDTEDAERHAREALQRDRRAPLPNYVMGSLALQKGDNEEAEMYLRRAADAPQPVPLAQNDLAEVLRRTKRFEEAEHYARLAVRTAPGLYVAWETLGSILLDAGGDLNEAEQCVNRACELSRSADGKEEDVRMLISLARIQIAKGDKQRANMTIRKVQGRIKELSDFEKGEFEELKKRAL